MIVSSESLNFGVIVPLKNRNLKDTILTGGAAEDRIEGDED